MYIIDGLRIVFGFVLVLFVPGYALTWVIFPKKQDKVFFERIVLSFVLSITSVMLSVLFTDVILGIDTTPLNIFLIIVFITAIAAVIWKIETNAMIFLPKNINLKEYWEKCQNYAGKLNIMTKKVGIKKKSEENDEVNFSGGVEKP